MDDGISKIVESMVDSEFEIIKKEVRRRILEMFTTSPNFLTIIHGIKILEDIDGGLIVMCFQENCSCKRDENHCKFEKSIVICPETFLMGYEENYEAYTICGLKEEVTSKW